MPQYKLGVRARDPHPENDQLYRATVAPHTLPPSLSYDDIFPAIDNQGNVGTCVAFGTGTTYEAFHKKRKGTAITISKRALYSLAKYNFEKDDLNDEGLIVRDGLAVLSQVGIVLDSEWPYGDATDASIIEEVPANIIDKSQDIIGFDRVTISSSQFRLALYQRGPIVIGSTWFNTWFTPEADGTVQWPVPAGDAAGGHCTVIVGYSDKRKAFRVRNQWGADWGDAGHYWLPYAVVDDESQPVNDAWTLRV